ncbi:TonB-dependent receptor [Gillisia sp. M10.2A]|uniref:TonB-dependent receptor n=1 Tax=Gillisia lutea TaxID=2909668 RepID=A0ABS9EGD2_9FLAO|nr:TonB-dependent receptor [Gillisia lutea]MCF4100516.1 TonB-dependent receptor [Gillisia lutea]
MKHRFLFLLFGLSLFCNISAQNTSIKGIVVDANSFDKIEAVSITIESTSYITQTDVDGKFSISLEELPSGEYVFLFSKPGATNLRLPVTLIKGEQKDLDIILLQPDFVREQLQASIISLSDSELNEESIGVESVSGLLQAARDVFLNAASFDFSASFFKPRGLDSNYGALLINGIEMNKLFNGRPQWADWGGLNDMQRNQVFNMGLVPGEVSFGGAAGITNIIMRASQYSKSARVSYAASNRSYTGRAMASYSSGELPGEWWIATSASRRFATEGFVDGTVYDANSFFLAVEKRITSAHSLNFTAFYTPNSRGKSSANTQEVFDLKGTIYNSFWGMQNGKVRNSRIKEVKEPVLMLNHFWKLTDKAMINTNIFYQFGSIGNSRIDYGGTRLVLQNGQESFIGGGSNPDPSYYQKMPSYFLRFDGDQNFESAYRAQQTFMENGQLEWDDLYEANRIVVQNGGNSVYVIAEDRNDDTNLILNSIATVTINSNILLNAKLSYTHLLSENFANVKDLLGGIGYLDIDFFAEGDSQITSDNRAQSDLFNRNRIAMEGERFKYNFELEAQQFEAFANTRFTYKKFDAYVAAEAKQTSYQRNGLYKNGNYPENSFGKSEVLNFITFGAKAGFTYKITGKHLVDLNFGVYGKPPTLMNSFSNSRQNNEIVKGLQTEKLSSVDLSYIFRSGILKSKLTGYFTKIEDVTEISFYYADGLSGLGRNNSNAFVQEVLTGIEKQHFGVELGVEAQLTSTLKLKSVVGIGQFTYANNPNLHLTSDDFSGRLDYGPSFLKDYRLPNGPQTAAQIGFEYRDPEFWWFGTTLNYFANAFSDISPLLRTGNFSTDVDGLPILTYNPVTANQLLKQEKFQEYFLLNATGGKSWRIKDKYVGFFMSLNNILDKRYKTGGYEQSRNVNYTKLKEDRDRETPIFANKYWYGTGASYYSNFYIRF